MTIKQNCIDDFVAKVFKMNKCCKKQTLFHEVKCKYFEECYFYLKDAPINFLSKRKKKLFRGRNINSLNPFLLRGGRNLNIKADAYLECVWIPNDI